MDAKSEMNTAESLSCPDGPRGVEGLDEFDRFTAGLVNRAGIADGGIGALGAGDGVDLARGVVPRGPEGEVMLLLIPGAPGGVEVSLAPDLALFPTLEGDRVMPIPCFPNAPFCLRIHLLTSDNFSRIPRPVNSSGWT